NGRRHCGALRGGQDDARTHDRTRAHPLTASIDNCSLSHDETFFRFRLAAQATTTTIALRPGWHPGRDGCPYGPSRRAPDLCSSAAVPASLHSSESPPEPLRGLHE